MTYPSPPADSASAWPAESPRVSLAGWTPTAAHVRAVVVGVAVAIIAVVVGRPDLLVVGTPLLVVAGWGAFTRPSEPPTVAHRVTARTLREGEAASWRFDVAAVAGADHAVVVLADNVWTERRPVAGAVSVPLHRAAASATTEVAVRFVRWGPRLVGPALVAATSSWGAFRSGPTSVPKVEVIALPLPAVFDNTAPLPHPSGVVGLHRSSHQGDGAEFAGIRPFQAGDRLRRIHWPVSLRSDALHVTATYADRDTEVNLLIDRSSDVGVSTGVDGEASSLDLTVRAAGALAQHFLQRGDRVGLRAFGTGRVLHVPPAGGVAHLRRVLAQLARVEVGAVSEWRASPHLHLSSRGMAVVFSPLCTRVARDLVAVLAEGRLTVVVDTMPAGIAQSSGDPIGNLAWRIRLLEREHHLRRLATLGAPVVPWRGPGSLDQVLRDVARNVRSPRRVRR